MPTYEYKCSAGHVYEMQQPFGSPAEQPCTKCGKPALRVLYAPPLVFKGGGFYKTANRSDERIASQQASSSSSSDSSSSDSSSSEAADKPAAAEVKPKSTPKAKSAPKAKKADA